MKYLITGIAGLLGSRLADWIVENTDNEVIGVDDLSGGYIENVNSKVKFANRYFDGDIRQLTYCMKDVYNWKEWVDLNREYKTVDFTKVIEEEDNVKPEQAWACAGGSCDII